MQKQESSTTFPSSVEGIRVLTPEEFNIWWNALDSEDRIEFQYTYGGSPRLARFVCALDRLMVAGARKDGMKGSVKEAFVMATGLPLRRASEAYGPQWFKHDAVQALLGRLKHRERVLAWLRIETKYAELVEKLLDDAKSDEAGIKQQEVAVRAAAVFGKTVNMEEAHDRALRTKRGFENARNASMATPVAPTKDELLTFLKVIRDEIGPAEFRNVLAQIEPSRLPQ